MYEKNCSELLSNAEYGIISTLGEDGYCYGVPVNYVFIKNAIYFNCGGEESHKVDNINYYSQISFTMVGNTKVLTNTRYKSIVVFGQAFLLEEKDSAETVEALKIIIEKYAHDFIENDELSIEKI